MDNKKPKAGKAVNIGKYDDGLKIAILVAEHFMSERSFYARICQKLMVELSAAGYIGQLEVISHTNEKMCILPQIISDGEAHQCVMIGEMRNDYIDALLKADQKLIFIDYINEEYEIDSISGDNVNGGYCMTRYLAEKGYRKIAFVGSFKATRSILDRMMGYLKYLMAKDIEINNRWILPDRDSLGFLVDVIMPPDMPEAFVCNCDETAYRLIANLNRYGYKVPENVAVTGYDDYAERIPEGVELTTWHVNVEEMVRQCVYIIKQRTKDPSYRHGSVVVNGRLVERKSV